MVEIMEGPIFKSKSSPKDTMKACNKYVRTLMFYCEEFFKEHKQREMLEQLNGLSQLILKRIDNLKGLWKVLDPSQELDVKKHQN